MVNKYTKETDSDFTVLPAPTLRELFNEIVQTIGQIPSKKYPKQLSTNSHDAANKFIGLIKFHQEWTEKPRMDKDSRYWIWPFKVKTLLLLEKYIHSDDLLRDTIESARLIGVDWRGDSFEELVGVMNEHEIMNKIGVKEYRKQAIAKMKSLNMG